MSRSLDEAPERSPEREAFYRKIAEHNMTPLWEVLHQILSKEPKSPAVPAIWHYADVRHRVGRGGQFKPGKQVAPELDHRHDPETGMGGGETVAHALGVSRVGDRGVDHHHRLIGRQG